MYVPDPCQATLLNGLGVFALSGFVIQELQFLELRFSSVSPSRELGTASLGIDVLGFRSISCSPLIFTCSPLIANCFVVIVVSILLRGIPSLLIGTSSILIGSFSLRIGGSIRRRIFVRRLLLVRFGERFVGF